MNLLHYSIHIGVNNEDHNYKIIENGKINPATLTILILISIVLQRGMSILGVSLPDKM